MMPPHSSPVVRRTTSKLLDHVHRGTAIRTHVDSPEPQPLPRMRPYAEQLAFEREHG